MEPYETVGGFLAEYGVFADEDEGRLEAVLLDASAFVRDLKQGDIAEDTLASVTRDVAARMLKDRWRAGVEDSSWGASVPFGGPNLDQTALNIPWLGNKYLTQWDRVRLGIDEQGSTALWANPEPAGWR